MKGTSRPPCCSPATRVVSRSSPACGTRRATSPPTANTSTWTGTYRGVPVSCTSTGIGAPSTSIAVKGRLRPRRRHDLPPDRDVWDLPRPRAGRQHGDLRLRGQARQGPRAAYAPIEFPAVASHDVVTACIRAGDSSGISSHVGTTRSADTFYARHPQPGSSFADYWQSDWREHFDDLKRMNVVAAEMEASVIFVLARVWGLRAGGVSVVLDNMLGVSDDSVLVRPGGTARARPGLRGAAGSDGMRDRQDPGGAGRRDRGASELTAARTRMPCRGQAWNPLRSRHVRVRPRRARSLDDPLDCCRTGTGVALIKAGERRLGSATISHCARRRQRRHDR